MCRTAAVDAVLRSFFIYQWTRRWLLAAGTLASQVQIPVWLPFWIRRKKSRAQEVSHRPCRQRDGKSL